MQRHYDEATMRESTAPTPKSLWALLRFIRTLGREKDHDYGTAVYGVSLAATAAFNYMASRLGITGFQASCADLDIVKRTRLIKGPFILLKAEDMLFPQYDLHGKLSEAIEGWTPWAAKRAKELLATDSLSAAEPVRERWEELARSDTAEEDA